MSTNAFYAALGERFKVLDAAYMNRHREPYDDEQPLRMHYRAVYDGLSRYWRMLAHVFQEAATPIGDDNVAYDAVAGAAADNLRRLDPSATRVIESMRQHVGGAALVAIIASLREAIRRYPPGPVKALAKCGRDGSPRIRRDCHHNRDHARQGRIRRGARSRANMVCRISRWSSHHVGVCRSAVATESARAAETRLKLSENANGERDARRSEIPKSCEVSFRPRRSAKTPGGPA